MGAYLHVSKGARSGTESYNKYHLEFISFNKNTKGFILVSDQTMFVVPRVRISSVGKVEMLPVFFVTNLSSLPSSLTFILVRSRRGRDGKRRRRRSSIYSVEKGGGGKAREREPFFVNAIRMFWSLDKVERGEGRGREARLHFPVVNLGTHTRTKKIQHFSYTL